jgi:1-aminocyclopropane-1-carboxylate deaminase
MAVDLNYLNLYFSTQSKPEVQEINIPEIKDKGVSWLVLRDDLNDILMSGNKRRKLKYNLLEAAGKNFDTLLTFGGAYSNHIYAVAAAARHFGFKSVGIIRGEILDPLNPTLHFAKESGMHLLSLTRKDYNNRNSAILIDEWAEKFGPFYMIPDGGTNLAALQGTSELAQCIDENVDYITCCCGTGGTLSGLISGLNGRSKILGFPVLKGGDFLKGIIFDLLENYQKNVPENWQLISDYHFGGYARYRPELIRFMNDFYRQTSIPTDPVYTGKMFYGVYQMILSGYFKKGSRVLSIHSGGLQGLDGFKQRHGRLLEY